MLSRSTMLLLTAGTVGSLALGSGLVAVQSDSVTSAGNAVESGTYGESHDVAVATGMTETTDCSAVRDADFGEPTVGAILDDTVDLNTTDPGPHIAGYSCVWNKSGTVGDLIVSATNVVDIEVTCTTDEQDAADPCTTAGDEGELGNVVDVIVEYFDPGTSTWTGGPIFYGSVQGIYLLSGWDPATHAAGDRLLVRVLGHVDTSNTTWLTQGQTDRLQLDVPFELADPAA